MNECASKDIPRYMQITNTLKKRILNGYYAKTGILPYERDLADEFRVSRNTVRGALSLISEERLIKKVRGKGNIINPPENIGGTYIVLTHRISSHSIDDFHKNIIFELIKQTGNTLDKVAVIDLPAADAASIKWTADKCMMNQNIKGILLAGMYTPQIIEQLMQCDLKAPVVLIGDLFSSERLAQPVIPEVVGDDYQQMFNAVEYLKNKGCKKIAAFGSARESTWGALQFSGYCSAIRKFGLKFDPFFYISLENLENNPVKIFDFSIPVVDKWFQYDPEIDGIIMEHYGCRNIIAHLKNSNMGKFKELEMLVLSASFYGYKDITSIYYEQGDFVAAALKLLADDDPMKHPERRIIQPKLSECV
jgi:DNA-binding transcriptional regulator YhcF (GntR family)